MGDSEGTMLPADDSEDATKEAGLTAAPHLIEPKPVILEDGKVLFPDGTIEEPE